MYVCNWCICVCIYFLILHTHTHRRGSHVNCQRRRHCCSLMTRQSLPITCRSIQGLVEGLSMSWLRVMASIKNVLHRDFPPPSPPLVSTRQVVSLTQRTFVSITGKSYDICIIIQTHTHILHIHIHNTEKHVSLYSRSDSYANTANTYSMVEWKNDADCRLISSTLNNGHCMHECWTLGLMGLDERVAVQMLMMLPIKYESQRH